LVVNSKSCAFRHEASTTLHRRYLLSCLRAWRPHGIGTSNCCAVPTSIGELSPLFNTPRHPRSYMVTTTPQSPPPTDDTEMTKYSKQRRSRWHRQMRSQTHPFLFMLITLTAAAELGLTAFLISAGNEIQSNGTYRSLLILLSFESAWTLLFAAAYMIWVVDGGAQLLANVASSVIWLLLTAILWGAATGFMHNARTGGTCFGQPAISLCRETLTVEALGWTEFSLCSVTLLATVLWISTSVSKSAYRESRTFV